MSATLLNTYLKPKWELLEGIGLLDAVTLPTFIGVITFFVFLSRSRIPKSAPCRPYLVPGFFVSVIAGLLFATIYNYYYAGGDTFWYYSYGEHFRKALNDNPILGIRLLFSHPGVQSPEFYEYTTPIWHLYYKRQDTEAIFMAKIIGTVEAIAFPSYWLTTVLFSVFSFTGRWRLFRYFSGKFPRVTTQLAIATLFVPSALFWGSGILKDTICVGSFCWVIYHFLTLVDDPKSNLWRVVPIILLSQVILALKAYILLAFVPAAGLYIYNSHKPSSNIFVIKIALAPVLLGVIAFASVLLLQNLAKTSSKYQFNQLEQRAEGFRTYHSYLAEKQGQSFYELGEVSYTPAGVLAKSPAAFNVTYFRPYPWEVNEPLQYLSAFESIGILLAFIYLLVRLGIQNIISMIFRDGYTMLCMLYSLIFGISVGITAYNFGALVRFKIPGVLLLMVAFCLFYNRLLINRDAQLASKRR